MYTIARKDLTTHLNVLVLRQNVVVYNIALPKSEPAVVAAGLDAIYETVGEIMAVHHEHNRGLSHWPPDATMHRYLDRAIDEHVAHTQLSPETEALLMALAAEEDGRHTLGGEHAPH